MAQEIFLLDYDQSLAGQDRCRSLRHYARYLKSLGVGRSAIKPMVFRPELNPYVDDAELIAEGLGGESLHTHSSVSGASLANTLFEW